MKISSFMYQPGLHSTPLYMLFKMTTAIVKRKQMHIVVVHASLNFHQ